MAATYLLLFFDGRRGLYARQWKFIELHSFSLLRNGFTFTALFVPGTIVVADDGLEQRYWFRMDKRIGWKNIEEIKSVKWSTVTITGTDGTKIVHSPMLADRPRFLLELKRHCGEELPPDFPREPIEDL